MKNVEIKGIIPPIITPMNDDESINVAELRNQVNRLIDGGVHALFPFGTNGEGYILNDQEKELVLKTVIEETNGRVPVYAGTGCISTKDTIRMSKTGNAIAPDTVGRLAEIDNIVGAKDSSGNFNNILEYIAKTDKNFSVLSGNDALIIWNLLAGGTGGIAGCANLYPKTMSSIYDLFMEGKIEEAKAANASIASFRACFKYGNPNTIVKTAVALMGHPVGKCRAPFNQVPEAGIEAIKKVLKENEAKGMA